MSPEPPGAAPPAANSTAPGAMPGDFYVTATEARPMFSVVIGNRRTSFAYAYLALIEADLEKDSAILFVANYQVKLDGARRRTQIHDWQKTHYSPATDEERQRAHSMNLTVEKKEPQTLASLLNQIELHAVAFFHEGPGVCLQVIAPKKKTADGGDGDDGDDGDDGLAALEAALEPGRGGVLPEPVGD